MSSADVDKTKFYEAFNSLLSEKREDNCAYLSKEKYYKLICEVKNVKERDTKNSTDYRRLHRYDVIRVGVEDKLIFPIHEGNSTVMYYVTNEDLFDVLMTTHKNIGHGGRHRMMAELKKQYKNVTQEVVSVFLKLCVPCQKKMSSQRKGLVIRPMVFSELNSRGQVDLIDMQTQPDEDFNFCESQTSNSKIGGQCCCRTSQYFLHIWSAICASSRQWP